MTARTRLLAFAAALSLLLAISLRAQRPDATTVRVIDQRGAPVPHAVLSVAGGDARIADDSGRIVMVFADDTTTVRVRRMGFIPFYGSVGRAVGGEVKVTLTSVAQQLAQVTVETARERSPLERTGFYDRVYRAQRGAFNAEFVSPEELDARRGARVSDIFQGRRFIRVSGGSRGGVLTGRAGCAVTVLLDGQPVKGLGGSGSIMPPDYAAPKNAGDKASRMQVNSGGGASGGGSMLLEDIVNLESVAAIEMYASANSVPAELLKDASWCAVVAIWTGSRH